MRAVVLLAAFMGGAVGAAALHIAQHHWGTRAETMGTRHIEKAGLCFDHADQCAFGMAATGHRLATEPTRNVVVPTDTVRLLQSAPASLGLGILSGRLPPLRGPPFSA